MEFIAACAALGRAERHGQTGLCLLSISPAGLFGREFGLKAEAMEDGD